MNKLQTGTDREAWTVQDGQTAVLATAIHHGHDLREEISGLMALSDSQRLQEEDPYTGILATVASTRIVVNRSRFEVDLNRPRDRAVYRTPEDAWGLKIWKQELPADHVERSLEQYDAFYAEAHRIFTEMETRFGKFVVLDLHSYNHRRAGADQPSEDPQANPEVNIGTGTLDRDRWAPLVDGFMNDLRDFDFLGRHLDVRENVKFRGGHFSKWIHENFPESACCLAVEFKKFFMDEWTGELNHEEFETISRALEVAFASLQTSVAKEGS